MNSNVVSNYDIIIFDCDGVLIDSNLLKCEAFGRSIMDYPSEVVNSFVDHCKKNFGVSRYEKFKTFFSDFAKEPFDQIKYQLFLDRYSNYCEELYIKADFTPSVEKTLSLLKASGKRLYVASGSDEEELNIVFKNRNLFQYFDRIYGSPKKKNACVSEILNQNSRLKAVFIGDAISDLNASKENDIDFIYMCDYSVQTMEQDEKCRIESKMVISTLKELIMRE